MTENGSLATPDPVHYAGDRRVSGPLEFEYQFMYERDVFTPIPIMSDYKGPIPARDTIILFGGPEADALELANLPVDIWVVHRVIFDFEEGNTRRVSVTLRNVIVVEADHTLLH
ncbi:MAG TPA: hypothetical protein VIT92_00750 [Burkholderiaceae bacterium]